MAAPFSVGASRAASTAPRRRSFDDRRGAPARIPRAIDHVVRSGPAVRQWRAAPPLAPH